MKEREFDMLENADDKTVELLADVPVLTKEEKERMLAMSKKKLDRMNRESNITENNDEIQVSGVERYNRPKWKTFASMAACLVLVGGIAGTVFAVGRGGKHEKTSAPMAQVGAESGAEVTTASGNSEEKEIAYHSEEELVDIASDVMNNVAGIEFMSKTSSVDYDKAVSRSVVDKNGSERIYYKVTTEKLSSLDDVKAFVMNYVTKEVFDNYFIGLIKADGQDQPLFREFDGELYVAEPQSGQTGEYSIAVGRISGYDGTKFSADVGLYAGELYKFIDAGFVYDIDEGKWKLGSYDIINIPEMDSDSTKGIIQTVYSADDILFNGFAYDENDAKTVDGEKYCRITDTIFENDEELASYFEIPFGGDILEKYKTIYSGNKPMIKEIDGALYKRMGAAQEEMYELVDYFAIPESIKQKGNGLEFDYRISLKGAEGKIHIAAAYSEGDWKVMKREIQLDNENKQPTTAAASESDNSEYLEIAKKLVIDINEVDTLDASGVPCSDEEFVEEDRNGVTIRYGKSTSTEFRTLDDIKNYVTSRCTGKALERYSEMYSGSVPIYKEIDGQLYVLLGGRGSGFDFTYNFDITDVTADSFTLKGEYLPVGGTDTEIMTIYAKNEDGIWKVEDFTID